MLDPETQESEARFVSRMVEAAVRIGIIVLLVAWCFDIIRPFVTAVAWAIIIATATHPLYYRLENLLWGRNSVAAVIVTLLMLVVLIIPTVMLGGTLVDTAQDIGRQLIDGSLSIPPPPADVEHWRFIGPPIHKYWQLASTNLAGAVAEIGPQLKSVGAWLLKAVADVGFGILQFLIAIIIAGVLLAHARGGDRAVNDIARRLAGPRGPEFADIAQATVRSVARGILGVALIQAIFAGLGFLAVGLPGAGFLSLICLLLATIQIGLFPILLPAVIYVFSTEDTVVASLFLVWCIVVALLDNVLKPILLGRGVRVPMIVIFVGAIGGFITSGIIGLFVGAVVLGLGYTLFQAWITRPPEYK